MSSFSPFFNYKVLYTNLIPHNLTINGTLPFNLRINDTNNKTIIITIFSLYSISCDDDDDFERGS